MTEHRFDPATVTAWHQQADRTRAAIDVWRHVSDSSTPEANELILQFKRLLAQTVDKKTAEWAFTDWYLTKRPIEDCVTDALNNPRPWPSEAAKRRRAQPDQP